jgi:hypothetical protein
MAHHCDCQICTRLSYSPGYWEHGSTLIPWWEKQLMQTSTSCNLKSIEWLRCLKAVLCCFHSKQDVSPFWQQMGKWRHTFIPREIGGDSFGLGRLYWQWKWRPTYGSKTKTCGPPGCLISPCETCTSWEKAILSRPLSLWRPPPHPPTPPLFANKSLKFTMNFMWRARRPFFPQILDRSRNAQMNLILSTNSTQNITCGLSLWSDRLSFRLTIYCFE